MFNKEAPEIADIQIKLSPEDYRDKFFEQMSSKHKEQDFDPVDKNSVLGRLMSHVAPLEALDKGLFDDLVLWIDGVRFTDIIEQVEKFEFDSSQWERGIRFFLAMILARLYKGVNDLVVKSETTPTFEEILSWQETLSNVFGLIDKLQLELLQMLSGTQGYRAYQYRLIGHILYEYEQAVKNFNECFRDNYREIHYYLSNENQQGRKNIECLYAVQGPGTNLHQCFEKIQGWFETRSQN